MIDCSRAKAKALVSRRIFDDRSEAMMRNSVAEKMRNFVSDSLVALGFGAKISTHMENFEAISRPESAGEKVKLGLDTKKPRSGSSEAPMRRLGCR